MVETITTILGDTRPVTRTYGDGSVDCPFCTSPILTPETACRNPWCDAHPAWVPAKLQARLDERAAQTAEREREARQRASVAETMRERHQEQVAAWTAKRQTAIDKGACLRCFDATGRGFECYAKIIKHRGPCPRLRG